LAPLHLYFAGAGNLTLEYQLPAASGWCDVVLLGQAGTRPRAVVIELKDWQTWGDRPGPYEGLMIRHGAVVLHPSEQVRGYVEYCRRFHSGVLDHQALVSGCVLFTRDHTPGAYGDAPNQDLTREYPCFTMAPETLRLALPAYFTSQVTTPAPGFAKAFIQGTYRQERGFVRQIGKQILTPGSSPFELLDEQRRAFAMLRHRVEAALFDEPSLTRQVIVVEGPPGSGKSVLAAKTWAALVTDERLEDGAVVITTTSTSQSSNWTDLFRQAGGRAAGGVVKKASSYVPVTTHDIGRLRALHGTRFLDDPEAWRDNVEVLTNLGVPFRDGARDGQYLVSIVDEAHALINPEYVEGRGQYGFASMLGPLAWHIIRSSRVSIFFLDPEQGFRDRENTTTADIQRWAEELGAGLGDRISLAGAQFRCAGSVEFVEWVDAVLSGEPPERARELAAVWQPVFDFRVVDDLPALDRALRQRASGGSSVRLLAGYAREWKTKGASRPHDLPPGMRDFHEPFVEDGRAGYWSRVWNFIPRNGTDYTWFIQAPEGSPMHDDPLCEVGCPYAVRGFDFDYVGVLWLRDLTYRGDQWRGDPAHVYETGLSRTLGLVTQQRGDGPARAALRDALAQAYRILLTRGIRGAYVWFEDKDTRSHVEACLAPPLRATTPWPTWHTR
jgi:DUF2075 family protein